MLLLPLYGTAPGSLAGNEPQLSDHFDGSHYFNPWLTPPPPGTPAPRRPSWIWRLIFGSEWPEWPPAQDGLPGPPPPSRVDGGTVLVTAVGHATFLIQMDGLNILTDPIWSERCSPVTWAGPKRRHPPGIRFDEMPAIDAVLISHNHYDHLDLPTLKRLAETGVPRAVVPLGNLDLVRSTGIPAVEERDWWQSVRLSAEVTVTLVPAQHFSSRTLWDRNETLWGGFVVSGPSGNLFFAGDTGYGPHFREIARRFSPIRTAILPIAPFRPQSSKDSPFNPSTVHMGPAEAVQAHRDLGASNSIAAHFQVFQLGADGYEEAVDGLALALKENRMNAEDFAAPAPGRAIREPPRLLEAAHQRSAPRS